MIGGAGFILAINLFVAGLFAVAFFLIGASNRSDTVARWFGVAYLWGVSYFAFEFLLPLQAHPGFAYVGGFTSFLFANTCIAIGITRRYRQPVPWRLLGIVVALSIVGGIYGFTLSRESFVRLMLYQGPYAFLDALCVWVVLRSRRRGPLDYSLIALFTLSAVQFLSKPFVSQLTGGPGATPAEYVGTNYALYSQTAGAVLSVATGLMMVMVLVRDMLVEATARSETDALSGLFNRRGFEERVEPAVAARARGGLPSSLVIIDLDRFKSVNDSYGHDAGDAVIAAFGSLLRRATPRAGTAARLGGEEFAVFLPGSNGAAARLFAESVRSAFANLPVPGLPPHVRCTASFGVAEGDVDEPLADIRRRADAALYAAKRAGRDRVALAADDSDMMPSHPYPLHPPAPRRVAR